MSPELILLGALAVACAVHLLWLLLDPVVRRPRLFGDLLFIPGFLLCAALIWRCSKAFQGRVALGWRCVALGAASWAGGQLYFTVLDNFTDISPYPSLSEVGFLGFDVLVGVGLWLIGNIGKGHRVDLRFPLDALMISLAGGALYWKITLGGASSLPTFQHWLALAYPLGDLLLLLLAVLTALWSPHSPVARRFPLLALGLALFLFADGFYQVQAGTLSYSPTGLLNIVWTLGVAALGGWAYQSRGSAEARPSHMPSHEQNRWSEAAEAVLGLLPSLSFAAALWLLTSSQRSPVAVFALILVFLGLVRQLLSFNMELNLRRQLRGQASVDTLTGVLNRRQMSERLAQVLLTRQQHTVSAVLFIDLDRFKRINDAFGHRIGDKVLVESARRIGRCIRGHDSLARVGGDEFVVILNQIRDAHEAGLVAERILHAVSRPVLIDDQSFALTVSIGVAVSPGNGGMGDGETGEVLLHHADMAMYQVKNRSRNGVQFYSESLEVDLQPQLKTETQLAGALERGEFQLHYQPLVDLRSGEICSLECLLRWVSPVLGAVPPTVFIPLAEERGLIVELGTWVLTQAAEQVRLWRAAGHPDLSVSVNISPVQFEQPEFVGLVEQVLSTLRLPGEALLLELTEGNLIRDLDASNVKLGQLRALGVRIGLDDFGTGYSSLSYLRQLQVDVLKIDRSFISAMSAEGTAFVHMILQLAQHLRLTTVAEGVETEHQRAELTSLHCDVGQGYLFSRPQPAEAVTFLLNTQSARARGVQRSAEHSPAP
ncbi:putative bifunctional diguanylate cyclase/phosphodiesterase [Deinococcus sp. UYEF24]